MKTIAYCPFPKPDLSNDYSMINVDALGEIEGFEVSKCWGEEEKFPFILKRFLRKRDSYIVLNWHEKYLKKGKDRLSVRGIFKFFLYFFVYRLTSDKLIYIRHNMYPHGLEGFRAVIASFLTSVIANLATKKVSHSGHMVASGYSYLPHPLYKNNKELPCFDRGEHYIVFGRLEAYKNIESLIRTWGAEPLVIAGRYKDEAFFNEVKRLSGGKNIAFNTGYIEHDYAQALVGSAKGLIISNAGSDMIVSGSFFFAITLGTPVYAIETPFLKWLKEEYDFEGLFLFSSLSELYEFLTITSKGNHMVDRKKVAALGDKLFGEAAVAAAWNSILKN